MHDPRLQFVQRSALFLLILGSAAAAMMSLLHWSSPQAHAMDRVIPPLLALIFAVLALRQWRSPQRVQSSLWVAWFLVLLAIAAPAWYFSLLALQGSGRLVDLLPPILPPFLANVMVMALFARPRDALWATLLAWGVVALPVLGTLLLMPGELRTPRGLELALGMGPLALIVPMLIPLLRGVERRFRDLHAEGERLQALAERDVLIGLYNRRAGERFLSTLLAHERRNAALILFDIDHFKRINDGFGHPAGDAVLIEVGRRCASALGGDDILARWGGEEFLVVLPDVGGSSAKAVAERLRAAIHAQPIPPVGMVSASFGTTDVRREDTLGEVLQRADEALYQAKAAGRNCVVSQD